MKHLLFNAVVLAALGYLFAAEGRIDIPFLGDGPEAATAPAAEIAVDTAAETASDAATEEDVPEEEAAPETATAATEDAPQDAAVPAEETAELPAPVAADPVAAGAAEDAGAAQPAAAEQGMPAATPVETRVAVIDAPRVEPPVTSYDPNARVIAPPPAEDLPAAVAATVAAAPVAPVGTAVQTVVQSARTETVTLEPLPDLGQAESVAALPRVLVDPNASALSSLNTASNNLPAGMADPLDLALGFGGGGQAVQLADGQTMMSPSERVRDLDRMIEDMELFFLQHTID